MCASIQKPLVEICTGWLMLLPVLSERQKASRSFLGFLAIGCSRSFCWTVYGILAILDHTLSLLSVPWCRQFHERKGYIGTGLVFHCIWLFAGRKMLLGPFWPTQFCIPDKVESLFCAVPTSFHLSTHLCATKSYGLNAASGYEWKQLDSLAFSLE